MKVKRNKVETVIHETPLKCDLEQHHFINDALREQIEKKAYELYQGRGCVAGREIEDWCEAEKLVRGCGHGKAIA